VWQLQKKSEGSGWWWWYYIGTRSRSHVYYYCWFAFGSTQSCYCSDILLGEMSDTINHGGNLFGQLLHHNLCTIWGSLWSMIPKCNNVIWVSVLICVHPCPINWQLMTMIHVAQQHSVVNMRDKILIKRTIQTTSLHWWDDQNRTTGWSKEHATNTMTTVTIK